MSEPMNAGMDPAHEAALRETYGLPPRGEQAPAAAAPVKRRFALEVPAVAGLRRLERHRGAAVGGYLDIFQVGEDPQARLRVRVVQRASHAGAIDALVESLQMVMAPRLPDAAERGIEVGDVAFTSLGEPPRLIMFVRDTLFLEIAGEGPIPLPITDIARAVDEQAVAHAAAAD